MREQWGGRAAFIIAAISSAIGLGNIWRFPGVAYENGGGAFLLPYLIAFVTAGVPMLFLDYAVGHRFRAAPPLALRRIRRWLEPLGWVQVLICFVIVTYYAVIIGWALNYALYSIDLAWGDDATTFFVQDFLRLADPGVSIEFVPTVVIPLIVVWIAAIVSMALGLRRGLDRVNKLTLPLLVVLFGALVAYALTLPGAVDGLNAFFTPDWLALADPTVWIAAYGHIFFSFSVGFGIMLTYSSYLKTRSDLTGSGLVVAFANCGFEILAGIGVFTTLGFLAFQQGVGIGELEGISGVGLAFMTFPTLLSQMPGGQAIGVLFFLSLVFAGFSSLLSLTQVLVGAVQDRTGWSSRRSGVTVGIAAAVPSVLLFATTTGLNVLDVVDAFVNNIGVVGSALAMLLLLGLVTREVWTLRDHLNAVSSFRVGTVWTTMVRWVTPAIIAVILVTGAIGYLRDGYGGYPGWFVALFGWGAVALVVAAAVALSFRRYGRADARSFAPVDVARLRADVERERAQLLAARAAGPAGKEAAR